MKATSSKDIIDRYLERIRGIAFPCVAAKAAAANNGIHCFVAEHMACPADDGGILRFLYRFVDEFRAFPKTYLSAVVLFKAPGIESEAVFDDLMWRRLQALSDLDGVNYAYDARVDADPRSAKFSFSLKEEAFYVIGLHPSSSRKARAFSSPAMVFNPHQQFVRLRRSGRYDSMRNTVRLRDRQYSGSINPMLADFGESSEAMQYSGRHYDNAWQCPLRTRSQSAGGKA